MFYRIPALVAGALLCASAQAQLLSWSQPSGIDSTLSGDYVGGDFACQLLASRFDTGQVKAHLEATPWLFPATMADTKGLSDKGDAPFQYKLEWRCTGPGPSAQQYIGGVYGPECPSTTWVAPLIGWGGAPWLAIRIASIAGGSIGVRIGTPTQVYANGGQPIQFFFVQQQDPASSFVCD